MTDANRSSPPKTLAEFLAWARAAPEGTQVAVHTIVGFFDGLQGNANLTEDEESSEAPSAKDYYTWREKLWIVPAQTRLGVPELAEALGRSKDWIYQRTRTSADDPLPHAKLDGSLVFRAGEIRAWLRENENVIQSGPSLSSPVARQLQVLES